MIDVVGTTARRPTTVETEKYSVSVYAVRYRMGWFPSAKRLILGGSDGIGDDGNELKQMMRTIVQLSVLETKSDKQGVEPRRVFKNRIGGASDGSSLCTGARRSSNARKIVSIHIFNPSREKPHQNDDDSQKKRDNLSMLGARNSGVFCKERRKVSIEVVSIDEMWGHASVCKSQV